MEIYELELLLCHIFTLVESVCYILGSRIRESSVLFIVFILLFLFFSGSSDASSLNQKSVNSSLDQNDNSTTQKALSKRLDTLNRTTSAVLESPILNINSSTIEALVHRSLMTAIEINEIKMLLNQIKISLDESGYYATAGLVAGLIAIALSLLVPFFYDIFRRPRLVIELGNNNPADDRIFLHGNVVNQPHRHLRWINRDVATRTRVSLEFLDTNDERLNLRHQPLQAKWVTAPELLTPDRNAYDPTKLAFAYDRDVVPNENGEEFDIIVKNEGDIECYAMTGDTYEVGADLRHHDFRIDLPIFRVRVQANSGRFLSNIQTYAISNPGMHINDLIIQKE